jgi:hypothetical protein
MRPDDAFWGARIVAAFTDEMIRAVAAKPRFSDPAAAEHIADTLIRRRDIIKQVWLNAVNPIVDPVLAADGTLTFRNAAVDAEAAMPATSYTLSWATFDNAADTLTPSGGEAVVSDTRAQAPAFVLTGSEYVSVLIRGTHPEHPAWSNPARIYFRRSDGGWQTVGIERSHDLR